MTELLMATARRNIKPGDVVMVCFPMSDNDFNPARKLDGQEFVVKTRRKLYSPGGSVNYLFELYGAVSDMGVPYSFLGEELIRI